MKTINTVAQYETNTLLMRLNKGEFDPLYLSWSVLRQDAGRTTKEAWKEKIRKIIARAKQFYLDSEKEPHRFYIDGNENIEVQIFVFGGYNGNPYETDGRIVITI